MQLLMDPMFVDPWIFINFGLQNTFLGVESLDCDGHFHAAVICTLGRYR